MFYRDAGDFKSDYAADQQIFSASQDRIGILILLIGAIVVPVIINSDYIYAALLIPFLIMAIAGIGANILTGYCGQISLGSAAFMAIGAYSGYNLMMRVPHMPFLTLLIFGGLCAALAGLIVGIPSLRIRGLYLAVATLAVQFFSDWVFLRIGWLTMHSISGSVSVPSSTIFGIELDSYYKKYIFCLFVVIVFALGAKNLTRGIVGRQWMAMRDMDVVANIIGIRSSYTKLIAFLISSFILGVAGVLWAFIYLGGWEPAAFSLNLSLNILFMIIIGGLGSILGCFFGAAFFVALPILISQVLPMIVAPVGLNISSSTSSLIERIILGGLIVFFLIVEPKGLAQLWSTFRRKMWTWPFPH